MSRHWTKNHRQIGKNGVIQQLGGLCRTYPFVGRISNSEYDECCRGDFRGYTHENLGQGYNSKLEDLLQKLKVVEAFCRRFSGVRKKGIPWRENILKLAFAQHLQGGVVWLLEKVKIVEMLGDRPEGGYGEVRRVRIAKMAGIPTDCDFAAKKSKVATPSSNDRPNVWWHV